MLLRLRLFAVVVLTAVVSSAKNASSESHGLAAISQVSAAQASERSTLTLEIAEESVVEDLIAFLQQSVVQAQRTQTSKRINVVMKSVRDRSAHSREGASNTTYSGASWIWVVLLVVLILLCMVVATYFSLQMMDAQEGESVIIKEEKVDMKSDQDEGCQDRSEEITCDKPVGTCSRMKKLPPTAGPRTVQVASMCPASTSVSSTSASSPRTKENESSEVSTEEPQGRVSRIDSNEKRNFPPPLSLNAGNGLGSQVSAVSTDSVCFSWFFSFDDCQELRTGSTIEVSGSPSFYARLERDNGTCHLEVSRTPSWESPDATIGPFSWPELSNAEVKIIGPSGEEYGLFAKRGQSFAVSHKSHGDSHVLTLDPVTTKEGCPVLEVLAGDGMPVGSARLNEEDDDVEIDADPDVDSTLIISCVLASFVSSPSLFEATAKS